MYALPKADSCTNIVDPTGRYIVHRGIDRQQNVYNKTEAALILLFAKVSMVNSCMSSIVAMRAMKNSRIYIAGVDVR